MPQDLGDLGLCSDPDGHTQHSPRPFRALPASARDVGAQTLRDLHDRVKKPSQMVPMTSQVSGGQTVASRDLGFSAAISSARYTFAETTHASGTARVEGQIEFAPNSDDHVANIPIVMRSSAGQSSASAVGSGADHDGIRQWVEGPRRLGSRVSKQKRHATSEGSAARVERNTVADQVLGNPECPSSTRAEHAASPGRLAEVEALHHSSAPAATRRLRTVARGAQCEGSRDWGQCQLGVEAQLTGQVVCRHSSRPHVLCEIGQRPATTGRRITDGTTFVTIQTVATQ